MDMNRLESLLATVTNMRAEEMRQADLLVKASDALKAQQAVWQAANTGLVAAQKAFDDYVREGVLADARTMRGA